MPTAGASSTSSSSNWCSTSVSGAAAGVNSSVPLTPRPYRYRGASGDVAFAAGARRSRSARRRRRRGRAPRPASRRARSRSAPARRRSRSRRPRSAVPAWNTSTPSTSSSPLITSPLDDDSGYPREASTTVTAQSSLHSGSTPASPPGRVRRLEQLEQVGAQPRQHRLRLGVAEAALYSSTFGPVRGHHQPRVEHAVEGRPRARAARRRSAGARPPRSLARASESKPGTGE